MTNELKRFDGTMAWTHLTPEQQAEIGALVMELIVCQNGHDFYEDRERRLHRPFEAGWSMLNQDLTDLVSASLQERIPEVLGDDEHIPIPSMLGPVCRVCRCSEYDPCAIGCGWAEPDLCTNCAATVSDAVAHHRRTSAEQ